MDLEQWRELINRQLKRLKDFFASCSYSNLKQSNESRINLMLLLIVVGVLLLSLGIWIMDCCFPYLGSRLIIVGSGLLYFGVVLLAFLI